MTEPRSPGHSTVARAEDVALPSGTVTFLFTDVEGSTQLWESGPPRMAEGLALHDVVVRAAVGRHGGRVFATGGDGFAAAFSRASDAVAAAVDAQVGLASAEWPDGVELRVRMGLHSGETVEREGDYFGPAVNRAARLMGIAHGGQVLVSATTRRLVEAGEFLDLGRHRLRDLSEPEHVFQVLSAGLIGSFPPLRSLDSFPTNLPVQVTSFVGRDEDLAALAELVQRSRLVTVTGVGGVGKTRLALAAASATIESFPDGVWLVELETLSDEDRLVDVVAAVLSVHPRSTTPMEAALLNALAGKRLLLVLDNCEHVVAESARLASTVMRRAPEVAIVATSREPLGVPGESVVAVQPLDMAEAVRLFLERAAAAGAEPNAAASAEVERVCRGLDGIPLAIELAAARLRTLGAAELARRLDQRFRLLTGGRTAVDRHQTLRATIDWSYQLLAHVERTVLARLSVFSGGCSVDAAEAVIADDDVDALDVVDALASLADKSLAIADHTVGSTRYRLLETIRAYAAERLLEGDAAERIRERHMRYFHRFARAAGRGLHTPEELSWAERVEPEMENLRAAVEWAVELGDTGVAMSIAASFVRQGHERPFWGTASMAEVALAAPGAMEHDLRGRVLGEAALAASRRGDVEVARERLEAAFQAMRDGARFSAAPWSYVMGGHGAWDDLLSRIDEGLALAEIAGDRHSQVGMRASRAILLNFAGDVEAALREADRAVTEAEALGGPGLLVSALGVRAHTRRDGGDVQGAIGDARRGIGLLPVKELTTETATLYSALAMAEALAGNPYIAADCYRRTLQYARAHSDVAYAGALLLQGGHVYNALGRHDLTILCEAASAAAGADVYQHMTLTSAVDDARDALDPVEVARLESQGRKRGVRDVLDAALAWLDEVIPHGAEAHL